MQAKAGKLISAVVSTHSRLKAAGLAAIVRQVAGRRFNTQPPEGGWLAFA